MPEQQLVEIAKALGSNVRVLILDEPTASLTQVETERLLATVTRLRSEGVGIIYISHRLEEIFEMLTWRQLGLGKKPCAFLDANGFWQPLMAMLDTMVRERFLHPEQRQDMWHGGDIDALLAWMQAYVPAQADKWLDEKRRSQLKLTPEDV